MVISDEAKIFELLEEYENSSDENTLRENVINLVRPKQGIITFPAYSIENDSLIVIGSHNHDPPMQDEVR